ncbi:hypothetical protein BS50DRAFT_292198 [Corynespora cassiicola Philippines]|uniref:Uncharacterized protein n=1 Tax=Corynespora cassiicola Philippines TaxID=1448308 RepID=A0A2T2NW46_CORCC|nr:hypothetical protein BS50DRAFT_292198 [Corynespora cassiicola Philippines]
MPGVDHCRVPVLLISRDDNERPRRPPSRRLDTSVGKRPRNCNPVAIIDAIRPSPDGDSRAWQDGGACGVCIACRYLIRWPRDQRPIVESGRGRTRAGLFRATGVVRWTRMGRREGKSTVPCALCKGALFGISPSEDRGRCPAIRAFILSDDPIFLPDA